MIALSKEQFYQSLNAGTWCGWDWCRKLYGYQYKDEEFLKRVYARLEELNREKVKYIYAFYVKTQIAYEIAQEKDFQAIENLVFYVLRVQSSKDYPQVSFLFIKSIFLVSYWICIQKE